MNPATVQFFQSFYRNNNNIQMQNLQELRVLVVEDDEDDFILICDYFKNHLRLHIGFLNDASLFKNSLLSKFWTT